MLNVELMELGQNMNAGSPETKPHQWPVEEEYQHLTIEWQNERTRIRVHMDEEKKGLRIKENITHQYPLPPAPGTTSTSVFSIISNWGETTIF